MKTSNKQFQELNKLVPSPNSNFRTRLSNITKKPQYIPLDYRQDSQFFPYLIKRSSLFMATLCVAVYFAVPTLYPELNTPQDEIFFNTITIEDLEVDVLLLSEL